MRRKAPGQSRWRSPERRSRSSCGRHLQATSEEAITTEAKKGYDLLFIGKDKMQTANGAFSSEIDNIASAFEGPLALVIAQGERLEEPAAKALNILVPITGTDVSRRAAELAFSLGKTGSVTALYVGRSARGRAASKRGGTRHAREILKDIVEMASRYGLKIETRIVPHANARKRNSGGGKEGRSRPHRDGREQAPGREAVFRRYRHCHSREAALINSAFIDLGCSPLRQALSDPECVWSSCDRSDS